MPLPPPQMPNVIIPALQWRNPGWEMFINGILVSASEVPARSMSRVAAPPGDQHRNCHMNGQKPLQPESGGGGGN